ncbi:MAG: sigma-70 family RNA polymerase sigma factor, partial [Deltaproteobacteria bacterium]|nr:sigma-70 family RNA polymerase sigma factor [Deltaproteobacteria bacterium]
NALFSASYRLIRNKDDAEDLVQEAFIKAYEHLARFDQKRSFFTWLYTICVNLTINKLKKKDYSLDEANCLDQNADAESITRQSFPVEQIAEGEQKIDAERKRKLLDSLLQKISLKNRTAVILRYQEELSYQEIAQTLGVSQSVAKVRVHRGLEKLRSLSQGMEMKSE